MNWLNAFGGIENLWLTNFLSLVITNKPIFDCDCMYIQTRPLQCNRRPKFQLRAGQIAARQERRDGRLPAEQPTSQVTISCNHWYTYLYVLRYTFVFSETSSSNFELNSDKRRRLFISFNTNTVPSFKILIQFANNLLPFRLFSHSSSHLHIHPSPRAFIHNLFIHTFFIHTCMNLSLKESFSNLIEDRLFTTVHIMTAISCDMTPSSLLPAFRKELLSPSIGQEHQIQAAGSSETLLPQKTTILFIFIFTA